ncbi:hypothetical protein ACIRL0_02940 [Streptomyces sp. NPDC102365]|uniref:hypothetical protein n=1 Tax=Streptomyces sp. NPDC102365 TaxID=3366162 RepID=UPI00380DA53A
MSLTRNPAAPAWAAVVGHALPAGAWNRLTAVGHQPDAHPWTTGGAWTVYAVRAVAAAFVAVASVHRRER